jgi:glycine cleavage system H protein
MSAILALLTAMILIIIGLFRSRRPQERAAPVIVPRYHHQGHTWVRECEDGDVLIGIDEFAQSLIGSVDEIRLPHMLASVQQGSIAYYLRHGQREVPILSPVSGRIVAKNDMLKGNPMLVNTSPYGDGWLVRIKPRRLAAELTSLFTSKAAHQWLDAVRARLHQVFAGTPALMYQDGGEFIRDLSDKCSDEEWASLVDEFFLLKSHSTR